MKTRLAVLLAVVFLSTRFALAHPSSGLCVADDGAIYFVHSTVGVARIDAAGKLTYVHRSQGGHWLCLDRAGAFANVQPKLFDRISPAGAKPALIFADGGAPIAVGVDGNLYFGSNWSGGNEHPPGGLTLSRQTPSGELQHVSSALKETFAKMDEGVTGLAAGPGAIYVATASSIFKVEFDGKISPIANPAKLADCDEDLPRDWKRPGFRGLCVSTNGDLFAAATGCRRVVKINAAGEAKVVAKSERPWNPTDVATHQDKVYFLEWTNANGGVEDGWRPRVRSIDRDGAIKTIAEITENVR